MAAGSTDQPFFLSGTSGKKVPLANCKVPLGNLPVSPHRLFGGCVGSHALYTQNAYKVEEKMRSEKS